MDKKEKLKYLSQWSGLQKNILDNLDYGYSKELVKIAKETAEQYNKTYSQLFSSEMLAQVKQMQNEVEKLKTQRLFGGIDLDEIKKLQESLNPSLNDTIRNLTKIYSDTSAAKKAIEDMGKLNLTRFDMVSRVEGSTNVPATSNSVDTEDKTPQERPIKITQIELHNFRFFHETYTFKCENGESILLYGENGSGKSSLYKAFELLIKGKIGEDEFKSHINIYNQDEPYIEFEFNKEEDSLKIDEDHLELEDTHLFVKNLSVFKPMLDYKDLLRIYFATSENHDSHNLFPLFEELLRKYPIEGGKILKDLNGDAYFEKLKEIILDLKDSMNDILNRFNFGVVVEDIECDAFQKKINIKIEGIQNHNDFLNEAKLSALALSIFFSVILKIYTFLPDKSLKILVLDDLLLSLNMSNRHKVLELLLNKELFDNFQFFIFTHDRAFFEVAKHKFDYMQKGMWKYFEMYVDNSKTFEKPYIAESLSYLQKAEKYLDENEYEVAGNLLRKETEKFCKDFLPKKLHYTPDYNMLDLNGLILQCVKYAEEASLDSTLFLQLDTYRKFVLNPTSHDSYDVPKYKQEIKDCLETLKELRKIKIEPFLKRGKVLEFELVTADGEDTCKFEIRLEDNFRVLNTEDNEFFISKGMINYWVEKNGTKTTETIQHANTTLKKFYDKNYEKSDKSKSSDFWEEVMVKESGEKINLYKKR